MSEICLFSESLTASSQIASLFLLKLQEDSTSDDGCRYFFLPSFRALEPHRRHSVRTTESITQGSEAKPHSTAKDGFRKSPTLPPSFREDHGIQNTGK